MMKDATTTEARPRENADDAYAAFMSMGEEEFRGAFSGRAGMTEAEKLGMGRALDERGIPRSAEVAEIVPVELVDARTGETFPATIENVPRVLEAAREAKRRIDALIEQATSVVLEASRVQGTKTFHVGDLDVVLSGGPSTEYDPEALSSLLREAGCPEERIDEVVAAKIEYRVNRSVLRQLTGSNPDYKAAAELAEREIEKPYRAATKPRR